MLQQFVKDCILWEWIHAAANKKHEEEGAAEMTVLWPDSNSIPHPPVLLRKGRWGKVLFSSVFVSYYPTLFLIVNKLNEINSHQSGSVLVVTG